MADTTTTQEPSMEEILASIRKIIADDKPAEAAPAALPVAEEAKDILELTQMVQDDGSVVDLAAPVAAAPPPAPPPPALAPAPMPVPVEMPATAGLASEQAISSAASALAALANASKIERMATAPAGMMLGNGMRTLEDMVLESMRPMLKDWLDQNLPAMVERIVQKEVERITKRVD
jgi:cell pole-organizing protein PopZ